MECVYGQGGGEGCRHKGEVDGEPSVGDEGGVRVERDVRPRRLFPRPMVALYWDRRQVKASVPGSASPMSAKYFRVRRWASM